MAADAPPTVLSADEIGREFGSTIYAFVEQSNIAESGATATRVGDRITDVALTYWYFPDPAERIPRATLWDAVRTTREPTASLAQLTAHHLEQLVRSTGERPEDMSLEEWIRWDPIPHVRDVGDSALIVNGSSVRAVTIEHSRFVGFGTIVGTSAVTIALPADVADSIVLSLRSRAIS